MLSHYGLQGELLGEPGLGGIEASEVTGTHIAWLYSDDFGMGEVENLVHEDTLVLIPNLHFLGQ